MASVPPIVRYLILCDNVLPDPERPGEHLIVGLAARITPPSYPHVLHHLYVYLIVTSGHGTGRAQVRCVYEELDRDRPVFASPIQPISFAGLSPLELHSFAFRLLNCSFPRPGRYRVDLLYDGQVIAQQYIQAREAP